MKIRNLIPRFLSLGLLLLACSLALKDGMCMDWWSFKDLLLLILPVAVACTVTYYNRWTMTVGILVGCAIETGILFLAWEQVYREGIRIYHHVIPIINSYYRTNYAYEKISGGDSRFLLVFALLLLGLWLGAGVAFDKRKLITLLPVAACFSCGLLLGYAPGFWAVLCLIGGLGFQLLARKPKETGTEYKSRQWVFLCLCAALCITALILKPLSQKALARHNELKAWQLAQEDKFLDLTNDNAFLSNLFWKLGGRTNQAGLTNLPPELSRQEILTVTMDEIPTEPIYLKNFTGAYYDKGVWYPPSEERLEAFAQEQGMSVEDYGRLMQFVEVDGTSRLSPPQVMTIEQKVLTGNTSPMPYGLAELPKEAELVGDSGVRLSGEKSYEVRLYDAFALEATGSISLRVSGVEVAYYNRLHSYIQETMEKRASYEAYAIEEYTSLPLNQLERLKEYAEVPAVEFIELGYLLEQCRYSFDLDPVPEGWDIVEYFLFEQQKGYCMHFASAVTLLLRLQGVPARYASGYLVAPGDFKENEDGSYTAVVRKERAHAWTEMLNSHQFWEPLEVTPGDYYTQLTENGGEETVEEIVESIQPESTPERPKERPERPEKEQPKPSEEPKEEEQPDSEETTKEQTTSPEEEARTHRQKESFFQPIWPVLSVILKIFLVTGCLLALILLRAKYLQKRREARLAAADQRVASQAIVSETFRLLTLAGIAFRGTEDEGLFAKDTEAAIEYFGEEEFTEFIEIARVARYGREPLTEGQLQYLAMIYRRVKQHETDRMKWHQRLYYRYILVWI